MGFLGFGKKSAESFVQGGNWADRVYVEGETLTAEEAAALGCEYASDPQAFYDGYREHWNDHARIWNMHVTYEQGEEPPETPRKGFFSGLFG